MRLFIPPDLHGAKPKIYSEFDRLICIGDYRSNEYFPYLIKAMKHNKETGEDISWEEYVGKKKAKKMMKKSEKDGINLLKYLKKLDKNNDLLLIPGNWDNAKENTIYRAKNNKSQKEEFTIHHEELVKKLKGIKDFHKKRVEFKNFIIIGWGISSAPEIWPKKNKDNKKNYDEVKKKFDKVFDQVGKHFVYAKKKKKPVVFFTHNVPYGTKLDVVRAKNNPMDGKHVGSLMARKLIDKYQPKICLGGHMHEHFGFDKIKNTLVVNVGFGPEKNTYLDIKNKEIKVELWEQGKIIKKKSIKL